MENNIQVQKAADISSLAGVVIVSLSALTAYNIGEKFNHNILFDATIFIISLVMLILTFAIFRKVMAGLFTTISSSTTNKQVQSECSQESSHQNANQDSVEEEQIPDSLERYESILVKEQLKEVKRKRDTMIAIREYVVEKTSKYLSKENISTLFRNIGKVFRLNEDTFTVKSLTFLHLPYFFYCIFHILYFSFVWQINL